jgi:hypothetical protein
MAEADEKKKKHGLIDHEVVADWEDSIRINRGQHADSDDIQRIVRHHRKETTDEESEPSEFHEVSEKVQKRQAS